MADLIVPDNDARHWRTLCTRTETPTQYLCDWSNRNRRCHARYTVADIDGTIWARACHQHAEAAARWLLRMRRAGELVGTGREVLDPFLEQHMGASWHGF